MTIIDILGVVGTLLGIGAALDAAVKTDVKIRLTGWLTSISARTSTYGYRGSFFLDRIFGSRLLSPQAMLRYMGISLASISISYGVAYLTTPHATDSNLALFPGVVSPLPALLLTICVLFAMLGDVASYAITRLFIRTVDEYQARIVSLGLVVADIITSLSLFFISFSFARVVCYALVLYTGMLPHLETSTSLLSDVLGSEMSSIGPVPASPGPLSNTAFGLLVANARSDQALERVGRFVHDRLRPVGADEDRMAAVEFSAKRTCFDAVEAPMAYFPAVSATRAIMIAVADEQNALRSSAISGVEIDGFLKEHQASLIGSAKSCREHLVTVTQSIDVRHFIAVMGPGNTFLAAFERTLFDAYQLVGFKFSPYVAFDPGSGMTDFVQSLRVMTSTTFLGIADPEPQRVKLSEAFSEPLSNVPRLVNVPFSPMAASSLSSSFFFLFYLSMLWLAIARRAVGTAISWAIPRLDLDKAVFTTLGVALAALFCLALFVGFVTSGAWAFIFG
jgi:hypothetical protein